MKRMLLFMLLMPPIFCSASDIQLLQIPEDSVVACRDLGKAKLLHMDGKFGVVNNNVLFDIHNHNISPDLRDISQKILVGLGPFRMNNLRSLPLCVLAGAFLCSISSLAQHPAPAIRIVNPIDESQRITLTHTVNPLANAANDRGAAPDGMQLDRLQLVLQRSPAQETALRQLISQQNTPGSPNYHQWLTPDQFGAQFGASDQDIATIESWLGNTASAISRVNPGKRTIENSPATSPSSARLPHPDSQVRSQRRNPFANSNDPQIPAALAPVVGGFVSLNNFRARSYAKNLGKAAMNPTTDQATPQWTTGGGSVGWTCFVLAPGGLCRPVRPQPSYTAGTQRLRPDHRHHQRIQYQHRPGQSFRSLFSLPANPPQVIIDGNDPGVDGINSPDGPNGASVEAYLDVEWAGAVAPNATVDLVIAADTALESGLALAAEHAVYGNVAPVMSLSFGSANLSSAPQTPSSAPSGSRPPRKGITVMVSSGDSGSAGCDNDNTVEYAVNGQAVNGFASTPYNVAVGGTDFYYSDYASPDRAGRQLATYWNTTPSNSTPAVSILKGVIPEQPWNDSQFGLNIFSAMSTAAIRPPR